MKRYFYTLLTTLMALTTTMVLVSCSDDDDNDDSGISSKNQSYLKCPDNRHPHLIDLGLPSGTKWACCNVGADRPEEYGGYYAWGETEEKTTYDLSNYIYQSSGTFHYLISDIAGTQYDVVHVKWGESWVMPSWTQLAELLNNCINKWTTENGVNGAKLTSKKNGASIFLPAAGYRNDSDLYDAGSSGIYWSSTQGTSGSGYAYGFYFCLGNTYATGSSVGFGFTVRPVVKN